MTSNAPSPRRRRTAYFAVMIAAGIATLVGVAWGLIAKTSAEQSSFGSDKIPTLPVYVYAQYTQKSGAPDYFWAWIGLGIAVIGLIVLTVAALSAFARRRVV